MNNVFSVIIYEDTGSVKYYGIVRTCGPTVVYEYVVPAIETLPEKVAAALTVTPLGNVGAPVPAALVIVFALLLDILLLLFRYL